MKRLGIIVRKSSYRPSSGEGIFIKNLAENLLKNGWFVDIILDTPPAGYLLSPDEHRHYYAEDPVSYGEHSTLFQFEDAFNFERCINFRQALTKAMSEQIYDAIFCNEVEGALLCHQMELEKYINVVHFLQHDKNLNPSVTDSVLKENYFDLSVYLSNSNIFTAARFFHEKFTKGNPRLKELTHNLPDGDMKNEEVLEKEGVMFIGRWEDRKAPRMFLDAMFKIREKYGQELKIKIMTRATNIEKFQSVLKENNYTNYEILGDVVGETKNNFIKSSKLAYLPYQSESFCIACIETLKVIPTILNRDKITWDWWTHLQYIDNLHIKNVEEIPDLIWRLHNEETPTNSSNQQIENKNLENFEGWRRLLSTPIETKSSTKPPTTRFYQVLQKLDSPISLKAYFKQYNEKKVVYLNSDILPFYLYRNHYKIKMTALNTFVYSSSLPEEKIKLVEPKTSSVKKLF